MKALTYLLITQIKNKILSLKNKPAFLILYGFIILMVLFSVITLFVFGKDMSRMNYADERILFMIIAGLGLLFLYLFTVSGLSTGSSLFTMPDVGLLFVAPISSKKILMYGLISTLGKALLGSVFIFYQIGNLKSNFGYGLTEIFALFIIFALMVLFCQLLSIGIYIFSNGNPARKNLVKTILYAAFVFLAAAVLLVQRHDQIGLLEAVLRVVASKWFGYVPITVWSSMFLLGVVHRSVLMVIIPLLLYIITGALIVSLLTYGKADYYEDVLLSTEVTYQSRQAAKEGRNVPQRHRRKIKVREDDRGFEKGSGAMTLFYKHILELRRKSRFIFLDSFSILMAAGLGILGYNFKLKAVPEEIYYIVLGGAIYFQYFTTVMGKLKTELLKPYIYLIPEASIRKILAASLTSLLKPCVDGVFMFAVFAVTSGVNPLTCLFFAIAYAASGCVFVAMTILYQRSLGGQPNKIIQMFIGMGVLFSIMTPSIGASVVAAILLPAPLDFLCTLPYSLFCILIAALIFVLCGNLIDKAEYTGKL